eukprot:scaffold12809_cov17-Tisochrysis_lutea.AAC.2
MSDTPGHQQLAAARPRAAWVERACDFGSLRRACFHRSAQEFHASPHCEVGGLGEWRGVGSRWKNICLSWCSRTLCKPSLQSRQPGNPMQTLGAKQGPGWVMMSGVG